MRLTLLGMCYLGVIIASSGLAAAHGSYTCATSVCAYAEPYGTHHNPHTYVDTYGPTGTIVHVYYRHDMSFLCVGGGGLVHQCFDL